MDISTLEHVLYEKKGRIAYITLNRPERLNALNRLMHRELYVVFNDFKYDKDLWVAVVTGAGDRAFCTGADTKEFAELFRSMGAVGAKAELGQRWVDRDPLKEDIWEHFPPPNEHMGYPRSMKIHKPIIVAINGMCCGGALHFVMESDIIICSENAEFFDVHLSSGQAAPNEIIALQGRLPFGIVMRMILMGPADRMSAQRAYELGLVSQVVSRDELMPTATKIAETILRYPPLAVRASKEAAYKRLDLGLTDALEYGFLLYGHYAVTEDREEGARAFAEKRPPQWRGR